MESGLPAGTSIGAAELVVRDLERSVDFYRTVLGLEAVERDGGVARLGAGGEPFLGLRGEPEAPPRPPRTTGLFHLAVLVPSRAELAASLARLAAADWRLTGASDHLVSEALYLNDPDGIGLEIYRDRPRSEWERNGGEIRMATLPLDLESVVACLPAGADPEQPVAAGTRIGHVHLNVADLADSERFYAAGVGLDVTVRAYPGALFASAGGYHHHLGLNTWNGAGVPPPPEGAIGLERFELVTRAAAIDGVAERLEGVGAAPRGSEAGLDAVDPSGVRLSVRRA